MNTKRTWFLCFIGITSVIAICFLFFNKKNGPSYTQKPLVSTNINSEENARTALNEIGQFLTQSYEIVDCIDEELNILSGSPENATVIIEKSKEALAQIAGQLAQGTSLADELKTIANRIDQLKIEDDQKIAFKETIQDFENQQKKLATYIYSVEEKIKHATA
jgi:hypothetical protein